MVEHIVEMPKYVIFDGKWSIHVDLGRHNVRIDHACMIVARGAPLKFRPPIVSLLIVSLPVSLLR